MKIGIFGGSFNPPHKTHKNIALELIENGYLDKIIYVPTGDKYNKCGLVDAIDRYNMVKLMIMDYDNLELSDYELKSTLTYTYQTLDYFKSLYPNDEIYFITGTDNLKEITSWQNYQYILDNFKILVVSRNNDNVDEIMRSIGSSNIDVASVKLSVDSSTMVRNMIKDKVDRDELLNKIDDNVLEYIEKNNLYEVDRYERDCKVIRKK